jgi:hypothetical protein
MHQNLGPSSDITQSKGTSALLPHRCLVFYTPVCRGHRKGACCLTPMAHGDLSAICIQDEHAII